jgi:hypothetical protein
MPSAPLYPAAYAVASTVRDHFAVLPGAAFVPDAAVIEAVIDAAFWASLRREEGYAPTISIAYVPPEHASGALLFEQGLPLNPDALVKLAPAVERPSIHLGAWGAAGDLCLWGTTRKLPNYCFTLEVIAPALLVVKESREEDAGKYLNVAVLEGDQVKILDQRTARTPDCPGLLASLLGLGPKRPADDVSVLVQLAISMRAHKRGGSLLVVPSASDTWRDSILHPITYAVSPPFRELAALVSGGASSRHDSRMQEEIHRTVEAIAGLTAVDGATVLTDRYELMAFGAKIVRPDGRPRVEQVLATEPILDSEPSVVHPTQLGGTRHLSAAQFASDQRDGLALVASQDGRFTLFAWSTCADMVQAHRVEALLL